MSECGIPLGKWSGSDATEALHSTIKDFVDASDNQTRIMIRLTKAIVLLTVLLLVGLAIQIGIQFNAPTSPPSVVAPPVEATPSVLPQEDEEAPADQPEGTGETGT